MRIKGETLNINSTVVLVGVIIVIMINEMV